MAGFSSGRNIKSRQEKNRVAHPPPLAGPVKHNVTAIPVEDCLRQDYGLRRVDPMSAPSTSSAKLNRWGSDRRLYTGVAIGTALITFIGFAQTYYLKVLFGTPPLRLLLHIHGLVMTTWFVLFFVQVRLIAVHRTDLHRRLGVAGAVVAGLALVVGAAVVLSQGHLHLIENEASLEPPLVLLPVSLGTLLLFGIFVTAAILLRRRADYHKRLMVLACLSILSAWYRPSAASLHRNCRTIHAVWVTRPMRRYLYGVRHSQNAQASSGVGLGWCIDRELADSYFDGERHACMVADCRVDVEVIGGWPCLDSESGLGGPR